MKITDSVWLDESEIEERYARASGAGGQHVNKTESAVQLRFDLASNSSLDAGAKARLRRLAGSRLTQEGVILIRADRARSRERNRSEARERLRELIERALTPPKPRKKSRPSLGAVRRVKEAKQRQSQKKQARRKPVGDEG